MMHKRALEFMKKHRFHEVPLVPLPPMCFFASLHFGGLLYLQWDDFANRPYLVLLQLTAMAGSICLAVQLLRFELVGTWYYVMLPAYLFRKVWVRSAAVIGRIGLKESMDLGLLPGYYLRVKIDWTKDLQTIYPRNHKKRTGYVRVSRRLYRSHISSIYVFCQYSRHTDSETSVKLWLAR